MPLQVRQNQVASYLVCQTSITFDPKSSIATAIDLVWARIPPSFFCSAPKRWCLRILIACFHPILLIRVSESQQVTATQLVQFLQQPHPLPFLLFILRFSTQKLLVQQLPVVQLNFNWGLFHDPLAFHVFTLNFLPFVNFICNYFTLSNKNTYQS